MYNYGKALENAGKAVISIARGMKMEEYLSEERLIRESARVGEDNANITDIMDNNGVGVMNDNGERLCNFHTENG